MLRSLVVAAVIAAAPLAAHAGDLTPQAAGEVVDQLIKGLDTYQDPAVAKTIQARLRANRSAYLRLDTRAAFAEAVSKDLIETSHDKHLKVSIATIETGKSARLTEEQQAAVDRRTAYGFMAARRLPANIGYIKLRNFSPEDQGVALVDRIMDTLKDTDALIIDLRANTGGGGNDARLLGHLSRTAIPMTVVHWRNADGTIEDWKRSADVPSGGALYPDKPVYVLTSARTFSAAEEFVYDLKAARRATVVGETTRGGANPANRPVPLSYGFKVFIPNGRTEHPTTHGNWEGVGITPDVATPADQALVEAYKLALKAAKPEVATPLSEQERAEAMADPAGVLRADAGV